MDFLIIIVLGFALMWLLIILPQRRRQAAHERMVGSVDRGDEVVTAGGIYGTVTDLDEEDVWIEIADDVEVRVARRAIGAVLPPDEEDEAGEPAAREDGGEDPFEPAAEGSEPAAATEQVDGPTRQNRS